MRAVRSFGPVFATVALAAVGAASAADPLALDDLRERFPPSSIDTVAKADAALAATGGAKSRVDKDFKADAQACLRGFLVNTCLDRARAVRRERTDAIEAVELEANRFKRRDKADRIEADRARREAERAASAPADAAKREQSRKEFEIKQADAARSSADRTRADARRTGTAASPHKPVARTAPPSSSVVDAAKREKNATDYANHRKEADEHQVEIARHVAEKTADRKRRDEAKAAKEARDARVAAANAASAGLPPINGTKP